MQRKSSNREHKAILLPNVMFCWGYNAADPHPLVAVSSSQRGNLGSAPPCIQWIFFLISSGTIKWNMHDGAPTTCIKFTNPIRNPDRNWGSKYVTKHSLHQFYQTPIKTRDGLGALVQSDNKIKINSESQTFHRPSVDRPRPLTFDLILPMKL